MVRIIDDSREESVGRIEDTGSYSTDDDLLDSYLNEYAENGVTTLVCEHTDSGVTYRTGKVKAGDKNFSKAVIQHLPSPYCGDEDEIEDLGDYDIIENSSEEQPAIRGKQGAMESINRFTSLASQSPPVTRERVDADWNDVLNEDKLPESAKSKSICKIKKKHVKKFIDNVYHTLTHEQLEGINELFLSVNINKQIQYLNKEFQKAIRSDIDTQKAFEDVIKRNKDEFSDEELERVANKYGWEGNFFRKDGGWFGDLIVKTHNIDIKKQQNNVPVEHRQYIDSRDEAPDDVQVREGQQEDTLYYDSREAEGEEDSRDREGSDSEYMSRDELFDKAIERYGDLEGRQKSLEAFNFVVENIMNASAQDITDLIDESLDVKDDWLVKAGHKGFHEETNISDNPGDMEEGETQSLARPVGYDEDAGKEFKQKYNKKDYRKAEYPLKKWGEGEMYTSTTAPLVQLAAELTGNNQIPSRNDAEGILDEEVDQERKELIENLMEMDREKIKQKFGDSIPVYRGLSANPSMWHDDQKTNYTDAEKAAETVDQGLSIELEHGPVESWTTNPVEATRFADDDGIIIQDEISVDEILASANSVDSFLGSQAEYLRLHEDESRTYEAGSDVFHSKNINPISIVQSAVEKWNNMDNGTEKQSTEPAATVSLDSNQMGWMKLLRDNFKYGKSEFKKESDVPHEFRQYIDSRDEAPDDVPIEEGTNEGLFYDIRLTEDYAESEHGDQLDLFDEPPEKLDVDEVDEWKDWDEVEANPGAFAEDEMRIGVINDKNGNEKYRMFITNGGEESHGLNTYESNFGSKILSMNIDDDAFDSGNLPETRLDPEKNIVVAEDVGPEDTDNVGDYKLERSNDINDIDDDAILPALAFKLLCGDADISGNIMYSESANECYPIDLDGAGSYLPKKDKKAREDSGYRDFADSIWDSVANGFTYRDHDGVTEESIEETTRELAESVDLQSAISTFAQYPGAPDPDSNFIKNVKFMRGELTPDDVE